MPFLGAFQRVLYLLCALLMEKAELGFAGQNSVQRTQQPIEVEVVATLRPFAQRPLHLIACLGPLCTYLGQRKVAFGQLCSATVNAVEYIDDNVQGLVLTHDVLDMHVDVDDS